MKFTTIFAVAALLLAGCGGNATKTAAEPAGEATLEGSWQLIELDGMSMHAGIDPPTLAVNDGQVSGFAGVNRLAGGLAGEGELLFGPLATTRMAGPPPAMELETRYLAALQQATGWRIEDGRLLLQAAGDTLAIFEPAAVE